MYGKSLDFPLLIAQFDMKMEVFGIIGKNIIKNMYKRLVDVKDNFMQGVDFFPRCC